MTLHPGEAPPKASSHLSPDEAIENFLQYLPDPCRLLVAFSGGGDSTGLLAALSVARRSRPGLFLHAATVDHGLRAGSSEEAAAASKTSRKLGVPHTALRWDGEKPATGLQAAARAARYGLLAAEARRLGADLVVTGHTYDDQLETVAMRRLRNPSEATGMDDAVLVERSVWVVRPFLAIRRQAIRDYLERRRLAWSEDPSNENPAFERIRIRRAGSLTEPILKGPDRGGAAVAAQFARAHVRLQAGVVVSVDLGDFDVHYGPHWAVLMTLIAIVGGQIHAPGAEVAATLRQRMAASGDFRHTAGGVLLDRRKRTLYLCREERGLDRVTIAPDQRACWDGRFDVFNGGPAPVTIAAGSALAAATPLLSASGDDTLPKGVARQAAVSMPRVIGGDAAKLAVRRVLAPFEYFLPRQRFELADSLAVVLGLEHFPPLPLGISPFDT